MTDENIIEKSGNAVGIAGSIGTVGGLSAAGITSGLAAIGGTVGGGMATGVVIVAAAPIAVGAVAVGIYNFFTD